MQYWLIKSEPSEISIDDMAGFPKQTIEWFGIRNYQARNFLRTAKKGDIALIYHSGDVKAAVGIAKVIKEAYPDIDPEGGDWVQIDIAPVEALDHPVELKTIKATKELLDMPLIKQSRLSVMPISKVHYDKVVKLSKLKG
mgnify:CR=1 FL=1